MVLPFRSLPKATILPATWAPTSMTSSGTTVPVALIVATRSPRFTATVRQDSACRPSCCRYHQKAAPAISASKTADRAILNRDDLPDRAIPAEEPTSEFVPLMTAAVVLGMILLL